MTWHKTGDKPLLGFICTNFNSMAPGKCDSIFKSIISEHMLRIKFMTRFYTKGRPLVKSNLICPSGKLSWQPGCPILNINIQGNFCISQGNGSSDNLPENLV